ncbi:hypothetical protein GCM10010503_16240 [Streptomyces lucensis JCM 4490]|uniref:Uncharacterized protein n=1 Tax=Streptomyces lucensis JCM 4490 TaxID=1306176 RepID=A0A918J295_9ACTN|nr:hypothetical protein GCM10010503_16240 [Streptomyces lucensis JCM 4490]
METPVAEAWAKAAERAAFTTAVAFVAEDAAVRSTPVVEGPAKAVPARPVAAVVTATATATERMCGLRNLIVVPSIEDGRGRQPPLDAAQLGATGACRAPGDTLTDRSCPRKAGMIHFAGS